MFDFKNYPELKVFHKNRHKFVNDIYKCELRYNRTGKKEDNELWELAHQKLKEFDENYAKKIFEILNNVKPDLYNRFYKKCEKWDDVLKNKKTDSITWVIPMIEENGGRYRLPEEYYVPKK